MKRACPTWHGGVAHQPTAYNPVKHIAYGVGAEGCFSQEGAEVAYKPGGGEDKAKSQNRKYTSDLYYGAITAYDTQKIKEQYSESWGAESNGKLAVMGALNLYLDFINIFLFLLRLMGNRR